MTDSLQLRGLRGATTSSENTVQAIRDAVNELVEALMDQNNLSPERIVSVTFSVTADLRCLLSSRHGPAPSRLGRCGLAGCQQMAVQGDLSPLHPPSGPCVAAGDTTLATTPIYEGDEAAARQIRSQLTDQRPTHSPVPAGDSQDNSQTTHGLMPCSPRCCNPFVSRSAGRIGPAGWSRAIGTGIDLHPCRPRRRGPEHPLAAGIPLG